MNATEQLGKLTLDKAFIVSIVLVGLYWLLFWESDDSLNADIDRLNSSIQETQRKITVLQAETAKIDEFKKEVEFNKKQIEFVETYLNPEFKAVELMKLTSTEAKASGNQIVRLQESMETGALNKSANQFTDSIAVDIDLRGTYSQVVQFFSYMTRLKTIVVISGLQMKKSSSGDGSSGLIDVSASLKAYRKLIPDTPPPGESQ